MAYVAARERARVSWAELPSDARSARRAECWSVPAGVHGSPGGVSLIRHHIAIRDHAVVPHVRSNAPSASPFLVRRCPPASPRFASCPWPLNTGCVFEALDMIGYERNRREAYSRAICRRQRAMPHKRPTPSPQSLRVVRRSTPPAWRVLLQQALRARQAGEWQEGRGAVDPVGHSPG